MAGERASKYRAAFLNRKKPPKVETPVKKSLVEKMMTAEEPKADKPILDKSAVDKTRLKNKKAILVSRHGKTALDPTHRSDGWLDLPLSDEGRVRLITIQQFVKDIPLTQIFAPDFLRTSESANLIASGTISRPKVVVSSDDSKTWNLGVFAGTEKEPNKPRVQYFMDHPTKIPEGGESYESFCTRFFSWLEGIKNKAEKGAGPFLLVLSGSSIRAISTRMTGDRKMLDLEEGGLMLLMPEDGEWKAEVLFGQKDENSEWLS